MIPSLPRPAWLRATTALYLIGFLTFLFLPLIVVAVFAFNNAPYPAPPWRGFTWDWFMGNSTSGRVGLFGDRELLGSIGTSCIVGVWVTVLSVLVGTCNAFLIERGADLSAHTRDGQTPLHCAVIGGHLDVIELLLHHRASLDVENAYGGTPLGQAHWSAAHGGDTDRYAAIVDVLTAVGARAR